MLIKRIGRAVAPEQQARGRHMVPILGRLVAGRVRAAGAAGTWLTKRNPRGPIESSSRCQAGTVALWSPVNAVGQASGVAIRA